MVISVNKQLIDSRNFDLLQFLQSFFLREQSRNFDKLKKCEINTNKNLLYICQNEMAAIDYNDASVKYIATDDMTTCHFIVLDCPSSELVIGAHLDGTANEWFLQDSVELFNSKLNSLSENCESSLTDKENAEILKINVFLLGGFLDECEYSKILGTNIISQMADEFDHVEFRFNLCKIYNLNNRIENEFNYPIHYGAIYEIQTHRLNPVNIQKQAKDPLYILRGTRFSADSKIYSIYNYINQCLEIFPFDYKSKKRQTYYQNLAESSDFMLRRFSTSPRQEKPGFESIMRQIFHLMADHPEPLISIFNSSKNPIRFKCDPGTGEWNCIDNHI